MRRLRRRRNEGGAAAVEMALVMTFILLPLTFAIIDFGFLFGQNLALGNAARQSARYAAVENRTCDDITDQAVSAAAPTVTLTPSAVKIRRGAATPCTAGPGTQPCQGSADKDNVSVTLTFDAPVLVPVIPGLGNHKVLTSTGVFRCEFF